jgi:hypothetical protein
MPLNRGSPAARQNLCVLFLLTSATFLPSTYTIACTDKGPRALSSNGDVSLRAVMLY